MSGTYEERRQRILDRLARHGMTGFRFSNLEYLNIANEEYRTPRECAQRMIILWAMGHAVVEPDLRSDLVLWFKRLGLWEHVSKRERELLTGKLTDERQLMELSWSVVGSMIFAWTLGLLPGDPVTTEETWTPEQLEAFESKVPSMGMEVDGFLESVGFRDLEEVHAENVFNELVTTYLRDHMGDANVQLPDLDVNVSFKRHEALNWLRRFDAQGGAGGWDDMDTST